MKDVISAHNLGVRFYRNRKHTLKLRDAWRGRRAAADPDSEFWAVRGVSFDVAPGESVGLVGANGHGKSTLLKLIAGVLVPDTGRVKVRGGVAPMIELTGGFESKLTARENIYLAGGLHGLSRSQIEDRFDSIVDFSEVGDFLDTPFRHFSSGMKVRLGFAVITTLDEPIVLVDEVLAVGDKRFRQKCYKRLDAMLGEGKTLFMVSHGEADLRRFCQRGLYMRHGKLILDAPINDAIDAYNDHQEQL